MHDTASQVILTLHNSGVIGKLHTFPTQVTIDSPLTAHNAKIT